MKQYKLLHGDCLKVMHKIPDASINMVLCDLPYGTTANHWDTIIPLIPLWEHYNRICVSNAAIVLFCSQPFTSLLISSNTKYYKYNWVWKKDKPTNHLNSKKMPMRITEDVAVFYRNQCVYNPQYKDRDPKNIRPVTKYRGNTGSYGAMDKESVRTIPNDKGYPNEILEFRGCFGYKGRSNHPTEKPVALLEYLIKTYSNEGNIVLDNTMGSGSTGVAAINTKRRFIGIEKEQDYYDIACRRIKEATRTLF